MKYTWHDGFTFEANDDTQVVARLRESARYPEATFDAYRERLIARCAEYSGRPVDAGNDAELVGSLVAAKLLIRQP